MEELFLAVGSVDPTAVINAVLRYVFPILALVILGRCAVSLLTFRKEPEIWAWLTGPDGARYSVTHWETLLGRARSCDVVLNHPTISRTHAVLTRYDDGSWTISDVGSKGGITVNHKSVSMEVVGFGDTIGLGGVEFQLEPISKKQEVQQASERTKAGYGMWPGVTLFWLTIFQVLAAFVLSLGNESTQIFPAFCLLIGLQWLLFGFTKILRRSGFEIEIIAFFLTTMGMAVIASDAPQELTKQLICLAAGIVVFLIVCWALRDLERAKKLRYLAVIGSLGLLAFNLVFGVEQFGARNWIYIGGISFQPSELVKICFLFVGASTLQRIMTKRNMFLFLVYSAMVCGCLVLMNDFGTALIFFAAFLVIAYMRSGNFATIALVVSATAMGGVMAARFRPHILRRFSAWGHVWENALTTGYQTRAMMCIASGGLFGLGAGRGWLKYVGASDTDLVFAFVSEEWGLLLAIMLILAVVVLAAFVIRSAEVGRSSFYTIGACAAVAILLLQMMLNVFGTVDILPLTGVTFPFVSNGGSSLIACWGLLAFIKAADTRQNASFAVKLPSKRKMEEEALCNVSRGVCCCFWCSWV